MSVKPCQVVVAFDFNSSGQVALERGVDLAARNASHVLHVVCVLEASAPIDKIPAGAGGVDYEYAGRVQQAMTAEIEHRLRDAGVGGRVHFFVHARIGKPAEEILALAREVGADLIVTGGGAQNGVERIVLGSVAEQVVRGAGCTVEVARPKTYADVTLLPIIEVPEDHHYVAPHRYFYENNQVNLRPADWPLY
jgi:nucleotide-binding universal stress UspA family protein